VVLKSLINNIVKADKEILGRALGIVPRRKVECGYLDLEADDYEEGKLLWELQSVCANMNHRAMPAKDQ